MWQRALEIWASRMFPRRSLSRRLRTGVDEIGEMIAAAFEAVHFGAVFVIGDGLGVTGDDEAAAFAMHDQSDAGAAIVIHFFGA